MKVEGEMGSGGDVTLLLSKSRLTEVEGDVPSSQYRNRGEHDCLAGEHLHKDLHPTTKAEGEMGSPSGCNPKGCEPFSS